MPKTIAQRDLRNDNAKVIEAVAVGESFVVTRNGIPVAELRPVQNKGRTLVPRAEVVALAEAGTRVDGRRFRADLDDAVTGWGSPNAQVLIPLLAHDAKF